MSFEGFTCGVLRTNHSSPEKTYAGATISAGKSPEPLISRESDEETSLNLTPLKKNSTLEKSSVEAPADTKTNSLANVGSVVGNNQLQALKKLSVEMAASSQGADTLAEAHADAGPKPSTSGEPVAGEASITATLRDYRLQSYAGPSTYNPFQALAEEDVATSSLEASTLNPEAPAFTPSSLGGASTVSSLSNAEKKKIR